MKKGLSNIVLDLFMPVHINRFIETQGERIVDKCRLFIFLMLLFIFITFFFGVIHLAADGFTKKAMTQFLSFTLLSLCLLYFKKSPSYYPPVVLPFVVSMIHLPLKYFQHGVVLSPTPVWFITIPPIVFFLVGIRPGIILYIIYLIEFFITTLIITSGKVISTTEYIYIFSVLISSLVWIFFMWLLEKTQLRWENNLKERLLQETHSAHLISMGEMAGAIAHEINNPLSIIRGNAQATIKHSISDEGSDQAQVQGLEKRMDKIINNVDRVKKIISSLNELSSSKHKTERHSGVHFSKAFFSYYNLISEKLKREGIELRYNPQDTRIVIPCDPNVLTQALLALTNNSIYSIKNQSRPWIEIKIVIRPNVLCLAFSDSGNRLSRSISSKIFEPFFTTKPQGEGTGIGLSIVKSQLLKEGGIIQYVHEAPTPTFTIEFPI